MVINNKNKPIVSILSQFSKDELEDVITSNPSLRGYLQGYLSEVALKKQLSQLPEIDSIFKIPDQHPEKGDLKIIYKGTSITIEVKSIKTGTVKDDYLNDTWQGTVGIKGTDPKEVILNGELVKTCALERGQFDILAISCYAVSGKWDFMFLENEYIPAKDGMNTHLLRTSFVVNPQTTPCLSSDIIPLLESVYEKKRNPTNTTVKI